MTELPESIPRIPTFAKEIGTIADSFLKGQLGLLIGAGMSIESGIPDGEEIAHRMLRRAVLGPEKETNATCVAVEKLAVRYPFEAIADYLTKELQYHDFGEWLKKKANMASAKPGQCHKYLRMLYDRYPHCFPRTIFTTNFDTLIEDELNRDRGKANEPAHTITSENLIELPSARQAGQIIVAHLHGCVTSPESIVKEERVQATLKGSMFDLLRSALATDIFVLVGYSLADTNIRSIFFDLQTIADTRSGLKKHTFAVSPATGDPKEPETEAGITHAIWDLRKVDHICLTASNFFDYLYEEVTKGAIARVRQEVAAALGKDPLTLDSLLNSAAEPFRLLKAEDLLIYIFYSLSPIREQK